jgi:ribosomal protein L11 methyltransferase
VYVNNQIQIRASFHPKESHYPIDIVIDPKMSFGTGHHETTYMMSETMLDIDFSNKTVFDFGSGTGILSILAAKLGAKSVYALDHEEWAYHNCVENAELNNVSCIEAVFGDEQKFPTISFDIILANINRNIIAKNMSVLAGLMHIESQLLISGFLTTDEEDLLAIAAQNNLMLLGSKQKNGWVCLNLAKSH